MQPRFHPEAFEVDAIFSGPFEKIAAIFILKIVISMMLTSVVSLLMSHGVPGRFFETN